MDASVLAAIIAGLSALVVTLGFQAYSFFVGKKKERELAQAPLLIPFVQAASDLKDLVENLVTYDLLHYLRSGTQSQKEYVLNYGAYRFFKYFWHHFRVLDQLNCNSSTTEPRRLLREVRNAFTSDVVTSPLFHLFGGQQLLLADCITKQDRQLMTYKEFLETIEAGDQRSKQVKHIQGWFYALGYLLRQPEQNVDRACVINRLLNIQKALREACAHFDPNQMFHATHAEWVPEPDKGKGKAVGTMDRVRVPKIEIQQVYGIEVEEDLDY